MIVSLYVGYIQIENVAITIAISIKIESAKAGIVIFVGNAARFVTSASAIAPIPVINNGKF